jgi:hypothetical protein
MEHPGEAVEHYKSLSVGDQSTLVVRGASVQEVVDALGGVPLDDVPEDELNGDEPIWAAYTLTVIQGGVLAAEDTGYADPPSSVLVALSKDGRAAAVVRNDIQAHCRFGCARDGELLFDNDEYTFLEDRDSVPQDLRQLFDLAWVDLTGDGSDPQEDSTAVALAMAEVVTGIRLTAADFANLEGSDPTVVAVRQLQYSGEKDEPQLLSIVEAVEGLAASQRVGRDVDGGPNARPLSGRLDSVQVKRTVRGTRRKMFRLVAHVTSWSSWRVAEGSWMFADGSGETYALDQPSYGWAGDHADQLSGSTGSIVSWFIAVDRPRRAVRGWNWGVPVPGRPGWEPAMFLPVDTQVTATLDEHRDETGDKWTTITIEHDDLPVEWADDMRAWWTMQLAIHEAGQEAEARKN